MSLEVVVCRNWVVMSSRFVPFTVSLYARWLLLVGGEVVSTTEMDKGSAMSHLGSSLCWFNGC